MYVILCAVGLIGGVLLEIYALGHGSGAQLESIWAILCVALAAAGLLGMIVDDGPRGRRHREPKTPRRFAAGRPAHAH
jgi:hypothetical protein